MAYKITDECLMCGACEEGCPNDAISEGEETYVINPDRCTECVGVYEVSKCSVNCSVNAIVLDPDHYETKDELLLKWKRLHPGETPVNI